MRHSPVHFLRDKRGRFRPGTIVFHVIGESTPNKFMQINRPQRTTRHSRRPRIEPLESRSVMTATLTADLLVDANRDGRIDAPDNIGEDVWVSGKDGRGAIVLPNLDRDTVAIKVAPFIVQNHTQTVDRAIVENLNPYGFDNSALRDTMRSVFGEKMTESSNGDIWQQDGYEIRYVQAP
jgi:Protein-arginine deiminase (PAD)